MHSTRPRSRQRSRSTGRDTTGVVVLAMCVIGLVVVAGVIALVRPLAVSQANGAPTIHHGDGSLAFEYNSFGELKGGSTLIVSGSVRTQRNILGNQGVPSTLSQVEVQQVLWSKDRVPQTLEVRQMGGVGADGTQWVEDEFPLLASGHQYILFLTPALSAGEFYPVGAYQGVFVMNPDGTVDSVTRGPQRVGVQVHGMPLAQFVSSVQAAPLIPVKR